jgi:acetyl esterase/lipase
VCFLALSLSVAGFARTPAERLKVDRLQAVHTQTIQWKMTRAIFAQEGIYQDFRAAFLPSPATPEAVLPSARDTDVRVVFGASATGMRNGVLFLNAPDFHGAEVFHNDEEPLAKQLASRFKEFPDEAFGAHTDTVAADAAGVSYATSHLPPSIKNSKVDRYAVAFRHATTHILARELKESEIRDSLNSGRAYVAHDWLCDPTGAAFFAENYFGLFELGDSVTYNPLLGATTISARLPVLAHIRLLRDGVQVAEAQDWKLDYVAKDQGAYRLEASLTIDGEERPWIYTNPIYIQQPAIIALPSAETPPGVEVRADIPYSSDQMLDLYLPKDKQNFPVMLFIYGGSWRTGDRSTYRALGNRFARAGIAVAIPSYRLMPKNPHPAQIEDIAAAFAWVHSNIAQYGGDPARMYVSGHSAGGHLAALLALDEKYLRKFDLSPSAIRGVVSMSGVYDVDNLAVFQAEGDKHDASPLAHVHRGAPPFLVTYCQWDYLGLPKQARDFSAALRKAFVNTQLLYDPGEGHITEVIGLVKDSGTLVDAVLSFVK